MRVLCICLKNAPRHRRNELRLRSKLHAPWRSMPLFQFRHASPEMVLHMCKDAKDKLKNYRYTHNFREEDGMQWLKGSLDRLSGLGPPLG